MSSTYEQFREAVLKAASPEHKAELVCPICNGNGYTAEHAMDLSCQSGDHYGCPIQVQCEQCMATGELRKINLEDVLRVCKGIKLDFWNDAGGISLCFCKFGEKELGVLWRLGKPAHQQSDETLLEIIKILNV